MICGFHFRDNAFNNGVGTNNEGGSNNSFHFPAEDLFESPDIISFNNLLVFIRQQWEIQ